MATDRILTGLALRLFAILCLASMGALVKLAEQHGASLVETLFFRQFIAVGVVVVWLAMGPGVGTIRTNRLWGHTTRTVAGLLSMVCNFGAVLLLPLAEATTFQFTVPIFATLLGALLLGERTGWHRWAAVVAGFAGVLIVAQPGGSHFPLVGALVALGGAFGTSFVSILLRQLGRTESAGTTVFWFSLLSLPPLAVGWMFGLRLHDPLTWGILLAVGITGGIGQIALTAAIRFAPVSTVVTMDYSSLIWSTLYGWLLFGALPTPYTWIGAPVIIASGLYIVWRERRRGQPESPVTAADETAV
jgi:drug/metabolite transporter (DMT)-like permease